MQVQKINQQSPTFNARIIKTPYLESGIKYAMESPYIKESHDFLNALARIKNDKNMKTFKIDGKESHLHLKSGEECHCFVEIDGEKKYPLLGRNTSIGKQCLESIVGFVNEHYGDSLFWTSEYEQSQWFEKYINHLVDQKLAEDVGNMDNAFDAAVKALDAKREAKIEIKTLLNFIV